MLLRALCVMLLVPCSGVFAADTIVVLNGKVVAVPMIESNGKAFVDAAALLKLLGGKVTYVPDAHKVMINLAPKPPAGSGAPGTAELAGENAELGKVYSVGKESPIYFSLLSAEYTVERIAVGGVWLAPNADEKLLILHFTIQNPQKADLFVRFDALRMVVVDAQNANHEPQVGWGDAGNLLDVALSLKPAQKIEVYTAFTLPAKGQAPKLMVQSPADDSAPVLRYDLRDKVTPLAAPFADPADATGATALARVPAQAGVAYPHRDLDVTLEKLEYVAGALGDIQPDEGSRLMLATVLLTNASPVDTYVRWDTLDPVLVDADGQTFQYIQMLGGSGAQPFAQEFKAGDQVRVRLCFTVPNDAKPKTLTLKQPAGREYEYPLE